MKIVAKCLAFVCLSYKVHANVYNPIPLNREISCFLMNVPLRSLKREISRIVRKPVHYLSENQLHALIVTKLNCTRTPRITSTRDFLLIRSSVSFRFPILLLDVPRKLQVQQSVSVMSASWLNHSTHPRFICCHQYF